MKQNYIVTLRFDSDFQRKKWTNRLEKFFKEAKIEMSKDDQRNMLKFKSEFI